MTKNLLLAVLVVALAAGLGTGCKKGTPTTCKGWAKLLRSPVKGKDAVKNLGDLHCKEALPQLEEVLPNSQYKDEILQAVRAINAPAESASLVKKALVDPDAAVQAAVVAEDFALPEFRQPLIDVLTTDKALKARENALKALAAVDKANLKQDEDLLIGLVKNDPNVQGIQVNALAAKYLGEIRSEKAIPALVLGLFIRTTRGEQMYSAARKALAKIGKPAVAPLAAVLKGDKGAAGPLIAELEAAAKKMGLYDWQITDGPELVQVLGDLRDPSAAPAIAASLAKALNPPVGVDDRVTRTWQIAQQNRITMGMMALWNTGDAAVVGALKEVILNGDNDAKQRLDTASALALLPGYAGVEALFDVFKKTGQATFRAPMVKPLILAVDWKGFDALQKLLKADKSELVKARWSGGEEAAEFNSLASVLKACKEGDIGCLIGKLKDPDPIAAEKAVLLLSNVKGADAKKAVDALLAAYPTIDPITNVDLRRFVLIALWRLGDKAIAKDIERLLQSDKERKGAGYWVDELETFLPAIAAK